MALGDEVVFFWLGRVELVREGVAAEVVERVAEAGCTGCFDGEHVLAFWVSLGNYEGVCLEATVCNKSLSDRAR